ncbi:alanine racemase [candidate division KSB1 bacterium]|nr:alanine racemase [candidate division KSB1 bacterium]
MRPTVVEIDLGAIAENIRTIRHKVAPSEIMAVVKANGYGHGADEIARTAIENGATWLAVALVEEGIELRKHGFTEPILVFAGELETQLEAALQHNLQISVTYPEIISPLLETARRLHKTANVHVKVDTGMGRVGIAWNEAADIIQQLLSHQNIKVQGLYTHFATSDERDKTYAMQQLNFFRRVIAEVEQRGIRIPVIHAANSGAILDMPETYFNLVRPGIMMYGYYPSNETSESVAIRPAMTFKTHVIQVKKVPAGTSISYGRKFITKQETYIATLPVGYADGYNRLLTNRSYVLIQGRRYPVVGRVCMDLIMCDLGLESDIRVGDEVILFGSQISEEIKVEEWCELLDTIPYEVCCCVSARVPRVFKQ